MISEFFNTKQEERRYKMIIDKIKASLRNSMKKLDNYFEFTWQDIESSWFISNFIKF